MIQPNTHKSKREFFMLAVLAVLLMVVPSVIPSQVKAKSIKGTQLGLTHNFTPVTAGAHAVLQTSCFDCDYNLSTCTASCRQQRDACYVNYPASYCDALYSACRDYCYSVWGNCNGNCTPSGGGGGGGSGGGGGGKGREPCDNWNNTCRIAYFSCLQNGSTSPEYTSCIASGKTPEECCFEQQENCRSNCPY